MANKIHWNHFSQLDIACNQYLIVYCYVENEITQLQKDITLSCHVLVRPCSLPILLILCFFLLHVSLEGTKEHYDSSQTFISLQLHV